MDICKHTQVESDFPPYLFARLQHLSIFVTYSPLSFGTVSLSKPQIVLFHFQYICPIIFSKNIIKLIILYYSIHFPQLYQRIFVFVFNNRCVQINIQTRSMYCIWVLCPFKTCKIWYCPSALKFFLFFRHDIYLMNYPDHKGTT